MLKNFLAASCVMLAVGPASAATQLLTNGGFETGDFTGWTASTFPGSSGTVVVTNANTAPLSGQSVAGPTEGTYHVLTGQDGQGAYAVSQGFTVASNATSLMLTFDFFSASGAALTDGGLDPFCCGDTQNARVDILAAAADPFETAAIAHSVVSPVIHGAFGTPYQSFSVDLLPFLTAGGSYLLRFGQADNRDFLTMGIDNVSLLQDVSDVPVPASGLLLLGAMGAVGALRRKRRTA